MDLGSHWDPEEEERNQSVDLGSHHKPLEDPEEENWGGEFGVSLQILGRSRGGELGCEFGVPSQTPGWG